MKPRLTTNCAKNYCNRTLIVEVIVENVVTFFIGTRCSIGYLGLGDSFTGQKTQPTVSKD